MEKFNFIEWMNLESSKRGGYNKLNDFEISCYRNLKPKLSSNCGNYITLSHFLNEVYSNETHVRVGKINNKVVFQFNKESGLNITKKTIINKAKNETTTRRIVSKDFVSLIYESMFIKPEKNSYVLSIIDIGNNTFMIDSIVK